MVFLFVLLAEQTKGAKTMEKYDAIYKCINDKLEEYEILLEYYREEKMKMERRILELEEENQMLIEGRKVGKLNESF